MNRLPLWRGFWIKPALLFGFFGARGERYRWKRSAERATQARVTPATSLREMAALLARCDLVVSNDNGPMHIAAAVGAPTVTIYGPTDPKAWNPAACATRFCRRRRELSGLQFE